MIAQLEKIFNENSNAELALPMKKYMKDHFEFLGINQPLRKELSKDWLNNCKNFSASELTALAIELFALPYREYQYIAIGLLVKYVKKFTYSEIQQCYTLIDTKSWWDSVDGLQKFFALWFLENPDLLQEACIHWNKGSMWQKRMALIVHLRWKEQTQLKLLKEIIISNKDSKEFFIQKAIGWVLRELSKSNSHWVRGFLQENQLAALSVREASKYL